MSDHTVCSWQLDKSASLARETETDRIFAVIARCALELGFDYCAYGLRVRYPLANPATVMHSNYPAHWQKYYRVKDYVQRDPTVQHGLRSRAPILWTGQLKEQDPEFWDDAGDAGLQVGWAQSGIDVTGRIGMLTLARSFEELTPSELAANDTRLRWLVQAAHLHLAPVLAADAACPQMDKLTVRELEVLRWSADGKTAAEIADILSVATDTVNYHMKNVVRKLCTANKTAAVAKAALMGMLT